MKFVKRIRELALLEKTPDFSGLRNRSAGQSEQKSPPGESQHRVGMYHLVIGMNGVSHVKVHYGIKGYSILDSTLRFPSKYKDIFERLPGTHFAVRLDGRIKNGKE